MTYPQPEIQAFIAEYLVPIRLLIQRRDDQAHFRTYQVIWTPTLAVLDRRGTAHYQAPGFLPPELFLALLRIGVARSMLAWSRYDEAATLVAPVGDDAANALAPEALYWLGVARYLKERRRAPMMEAWKRLKTEHRASVWAARVPPNQEELDEP